jgi:hypothetical protein
MAALASAAEVPPGGEAEITTKTDVSGRRGAIVKTVNVETSDPNQPHITLSLKATVLVDVELDPETIDLNMIVKGDKVTGVAKLVTARPGEVKLTKIVPLEDGEGDVKVTLVRGQEVRAEATPAELGLINRRFEVYTTSEKQPVLTLLVFGHVVGIWEISPRTVSFRQTAEETPRATVEVTPRRRTRYRVTKAEDLSGAVETVLKRTSKGYTVDLALKEIPSRRRGTIDITTDDPDERLITVRYYVRRARLPRRRPTKR